MQIIHDQNPRNGAIAIDLHLVGMPSSIGTDSNGIDWYRTGPDGLIELTGLKNAVLERVSDSSVASVVAGRSGEVVISTLLVPEWDEAMSGRCSMRRRRRELVVPAVVHDRGHRVRLLRGRDHPPRGGEVIEVGGLDVLPDGSLALSTRRGRVWIVENPDTEDPADAIWHMFADGLAEGWVSRWSMVTSTCWRGELSRP